MIASILKQKQNHGGRNVKGDTNQNHMEQHRANQPVDFIAARQGGKLSRSKLNSEITNDLALVLGRDRGSDPQSPK